MPIRMRTDYRSRLRDIREDHDLTQEYVGKLLCKSQQGYNHIESGRAELKICRPFLGVILLYFRDL